MHRILNGPSFGAASYDDVHRDMFQMDLTGNDVLTCNDVVFHVGGNWGENENPGPNQLPYNNLRTVIQVFTCAI